MSEHGSRSFWVVGLALFSMFFGSGNLIFPLFTGQIAGEHILAALVGFFTTGVFVPFLGVVIMVLFRGNYPRFFASLGGRVGRIITALLLVVWIPLGSAPRCITLAYASLLPYLSLPPLWMFSLLYCGLLFLVVAKKSRAIDLLGYVLTPALLTCLGIIFWKGIALQEISLGFSAGSVPVFRQALLEGYNTMDLIAAFFFAATIINLLKRKTEENALGTAVKSCLVGMFLLGLVYFGLILLAGQHVEVLADVPKDQLLAYAARHVLGPVYGGIAAVAVVLACFTTSVALAIVFREYLCQENLPVVQKKESRAVLVTLAITFGMSIFGLAGITAVTAPILKVLYPFLIGMILYHLGKETVLYLQTRAAKVSET